VQVYVGTSVISVRKDELYYTYYKDQSVTICFIKI